MNFKGSSILSVDQFDCKDIETVVKAAQKMEKYASRAIGTNVLKGAVLGNLFFEPSTRTRISFGTAFSRLGGSVNETVGLKFSSVTKGESILDTSKVIGSYVDVIVVRHPQKGTVAKFAEATNVPIINGGDGIGEHPTQALLDLYTIVKEKYGTTKKLENFTIAMVGDLAYGRTVHSLSKLLSLYNNITFVLTSPAKLQMPEYIVTLIKERGHKVIITEDLANGIKEADVIYVTRIQEERFESTAAYQKYRGVYSINKAKFTSICKPDAIIMHPLPRDSREGANELDTDLDQLPNLAIFRQTYNGVPIRMALFALVLGVDGIVDEYQTKITWYSAKNKQKAII